MKTKQTVKSASPAIAMQSAVIGGAQEMGESPWNKGKAGRKTKANPATPAKRAVITKDKIKQAAKRIPLADTRTAEAQSKAEAKPSKAKPQAKRELPARKRGQGESYTEAVPHSGEVTVFASDIVQAGAWVKSTYLPILKEWEARLKNGDPVQGGKTGLKTPAWPAFKAMLEFAAPTLAPVMHAPSMGKHKPSKGKVKSRKPQAKLALVVWQRENKDFFRKEVNPRHDRIHSILSGVVNRSVNKEAMDDGKLRMRLFRKTVCLSAPKA